MTDPSDTGKFSTGENVAPERERPQDDVGYPQVGGDSAAATSGNVSRETGAAPDREPVNVPRETSTAPTTPPPARTGVMTAAQLAERAAVSDDNLTPLARAAQATVMVRAGIPQERLDRPAETRVFVVANQKGGVGKTTSTVNLAAALTQLGQKVLVVDLDPQGNASTALSIEHRQGTPSSYELLVDGAAIGDLAMPCAEAPGMWVVPATIDLAGAEIELVSVVAREQRLKKALDAYPLVGSAADAGEDRFDYVLIDCPPSLGLITVNMLAAADALLIPVQCEYYALEGLSQLLNTVHLVQRGVNPELAIDGGILTMYDARLNLSRQVADEEGAAPAVAAHQFQREAAELRRERAMHEDDMHGHPAPSASCCARFRAVFRSGR